MGEGETLYQLVEEGYDGHACTLLAGPQGVDVAGMWQAFRERYRTERRRVTDEFHRAHEGRPWDAEFMREILDHQRRRLLGEFPDVTEGIDMCDEVGVFVSLLRCHGLRRVTPVVVNVD